MIGRRDELAYFQSNFYRDQYRRMIRLLKVATFFVFLLIAAIIYSILFQPSADFYANSTDGKILLMPHPK